MNGSDFYITNVIGNTVARIVDGLETNRNNKIIVKIFCPEKHQQICNDQIFISDGRVSRGTWAYSIFKDYIVTDFNLDDVNCSTIPVLTLYVREPEPQQQFYIDEFVGAKTIMDYTLCYDEAKKFRVKRVMIHGPATIVFWEDGTKTVAKCLPEDKFDFEKGIALCFMKKATKESCAKIFESARKDTLKKLKDDMAKLNKDLAKRDGIKCYEDATSTS